MKQLLLLALLLPGLKIYSQQQTLQVTGKNLTTVSGQVLTLRGINYPIIDDGNISLSNAAEYQHKIDEAAQTGANCIRIPWYTDGRHWRDNPAYGGPGVVSGYVNNGHLGNILSYCVEKGMIPILEIHDPNMYDGSEYITCSNDWNYLNTTVANWWKSTVIVNLIAAHKEHLIINLANEFGYVQWADNSSVGLTTFKNNYNALISDLRELDINVPIMIDSPDCGQSSTHLLSIAESMVNSDPAHNLIFSSHAYWSGYASTQAQVQTKLNEAQNTNVCFVLGEIANTQDGDSCGSISLSSLYPIILQEACARNIGWLGWTYDQDCSDPREMTTDGEFENLTTYGNDLVYNANYGLLSSGTCAATALGINKNSLANFSIYPNPANKTIDIVTTAGINNVYIYDLSGRVIKELPGTSGHIDVSFLSAGTYVMQVKTANGEVFSKKLVKI